MFKKLLAAVGIGGVEVETVLHQEVVSPGGVIDGVIRLRSGDVEQEISGVYVELATRVEHEVGDDEVDLMRSFGRVAVGGGTVLPPEQVVELPFRLPVPMETPVTHYRGQVLRGAQVAVRTVVDISGAVDATDTDPVGIAALPIQHAVLQTLEQLGFPLRTADVEFGSIPPTRQQLPFYQEIEFAGSPNYPRLQQLELTFVAGADGMDIVLESNKKVGLLTGGDQLHVLPVGYDAVERLDWPAELHKILDSLGQGWF